MEQKNRLPGTDTLKKVTWKPSPVARLILKSKQNRALKKLGAFCHPEVADRIHGAIVDDEMFYYRDGFHVDGLKLEPVDVDETWPQWIADGHAPASWYRPRD